MFNSNLNVVRDLPSSFSSVKRFRNKASRHISFSSIQWPGARPRCTVYCTQAPYKARSFERMSREVGHYRDKKLCGHDWARAYSCKGLVRVASRTLGGKARQMLQSVCSLVLQPAVSHLPARTLRAGDLQSAHAKPLGKRPASARHKLVDQGTPKPISLPQGET